MQPFKGMMDLSQSNPAEFAALFMSRARVDELVKWDTVVVANVAAGKMSQADRFDSAISFFRQLLASVYFITSALELGCATAKEAGRRFDAVRSRATNSLGFDPLAELERHPSSSAGASEDDLDEPLPSREWMRNVVTSFLATTDMATLQTQASLRGRLHEVVDLVGKLRRFLRRVDVFSEQRLMILSEKYALGELGLAEFAEIVGVDQDEALVRLSHAKQVNPPKKRIYRSAPEEEDDLRAALDEVAGGQSVDLTDGELTEWDETGELPASVDARCHG
jgi:hypothetical protein